MPNPAEIILSQLGGSGRLGAMIGAHTFLHSAKDPSWLSFKFKGSRKANYVRVTLDASDSYTVQLMKLRGFDAKEVYTASGIDVCRLRAAIEDNTGLYLSL